MKHVRQSIGFGAAVLLCVTAFAVPARESVLETRCVLYGIATSAKQAVQPAAASQS